MTSTKTFRSLVQPGRVHRRLYTDPAIFEAEMERIFGNAWIYVGHESQVRKPGDYVRAFIGRKPVVLVRDAEGEIRVIHNQCAHRGSLVVANDKGNTDEFQCCYHGWTYHLISTAGSTRCRCNTAIRATSIRTTRRRRWFPPLG